MGEKRETSSSKSTWLRRSDIFGDISGGLSVSILVLPSAISCGLLAFAPLGHSYISVGVVAGLYSAVFVTLIAALFGRSPFHMSGPRSSLAIILGALVAGLATAKGLPPEGAERTGVLIALMMLCALLAGVFQILFGVLRLGAVIKFIPNAVIAGLLNGFAIIIVMQQFPVFLGVTRITLNHILDLTNAIDIASISIGTITIVTMLAGERFLKHIRTGERFFKYIPKSLLGLVTGTVAYHFLAIGHGEKGFAGGLVGDIPARLPTIDALQDIADTLMMPDILVSALPLVIGSALTIAALASILSLLSTSHADALSHAHNDGNRELVAQGFANIGSAAFGGLPGSGSIARTTINYQVGGRTRLSSVVHALFFLLAATVMGPLVSNIPVVSISSLLLVFAVRMFDAETGRMITSVWRSGLLYARSETVTELFVVAIVTATTVFIGLVQAAGVGLVISSLVFAQRMGRSVVRSEQSGAHLRSRTVRSHHAATLLDREGDQIKVFEVQGAIFFGSADQLSVVVRDALERAEIIIFDLRLVSDLDSTGLKILHKIDATVRQQKKTLLISFLSPERSLWSTIKALSVQEDFFSERVYPDTDTALSAAEDMLLANFGADSSSRDLELCEVDAFQKMTTEQIRLIESKMSRDTFSSGTYIVEQGETKNAMYFLVSGSVSIHLDVEGATHSTRLGSYKPGVVFGEMAVLSDMPRSASVIADGETIVWTLHRASFEELLKENPEEINILLLGISRELTTRLRAASDQMAKLER